MAPQRQGGAHDLRARRQSPGGPVRPGAPCGTGAERYCHASLFMTLRVLDPGLMTLLVDWGRPRTRSLGVAVGGAAAPWAPPTPTAPVGNPPPTPHLENH